MRKKSAFWLFWTWTSKFHQNKSSLLSSRARWYWCTFFDLTTYYLGVILSVNKLRLELQGLNGRNGAFWKACSGSEMSFIFFAFIEIKLKKKSFFTIEWKLFKGFLTFGRNKNFLKIHRRLSFFSKKVWYYFTFFKR